MYRRITVDAIVVLLLMAACCAAVMAQTSTVPDEGVRGSGAILTSIKTTGTFDINVGRSGDVLSGGFRYTELSSTNVRGNTIYSQMITGLKIVGNRATITADGYWNGMPAYLTIEALDDLNMDWFHIIAKPKGQILVIYDQSGGLIKGDISIFSTTPVPDCYVKGDGTIAVLRNIGKFTVSAEQTADVVKGSVYYVEYNPYSMSIVERPKAKIYVPEIAKLTINGNEAILAGKGTLNGLPAMVEVRVKDNSNLMLPVAIPDEFYIKALPLNSSSLSRIGYEAGGPVKTGGIVIAIKNTIP